MQKRYYSLVQAENEATINIYGDITSWPYLKSDVSSYNLSQQLANLDENVSNIHVYINSYGGEVGEGLAIFNALKRHKAKVTTHCDGFACSIASVVFMAGDERIMNQASLLMIHNAWAYMEGNAEQLRKQADDLDTITQASIEAYKSRCSISEDEIKALMNAETWLSPEKAVEYGFATAIEADGEAERPSQNARKKLFAMLQSINHDINHDINQEIEIDDEPTDDEENPKDVPPAEADTEENTDTENPTEPETEEQPETETEETETEDEEEKETNNNENEAINQKIVAFFNSIIGGK